MKIPTTPERSESPTSLIFADGAINSLRVENITSDDSPNCLKPALVQPQKSKWYSGETPIYALSLIISWPLNKASE